MKTKYALPIALGVAVTIASIIASAVRSSTQPEPVTATKALTKASHPGPYVGSIQNPAMKELLADFEVFMRQAIENNLAPGAAVAIIQDTSIVYLKGFGLRSVISKDSIDIHSVFRIGSVSKCFASILTGLLVEENILSWDDPVVKYLPNFRLKSEEQTKALTLRHVLSHTTGLPYHAFTDRVDAGANFDTLVYHLRDLDLLGKPGQLFSYQNVGYSLIGEVIRSATGKTYAENLKEKIFTPLHMQDASSTYGEIIGNKNVALPHRKKKTWNPLPISNTYYNVAPAGGVNASIADMACWLRAITASSSNLMSQETRREIFRPEVRAASRNRNFWRWKPLRAAYYGLGWRVLYFIGDTLAYHGGYVNGYRSEVAVEQKDNVAICVLVDAPGTLSDSSIPKFLQLYSQRRDAILQWNKTKTESFAGK